MIEAKLGSAGPVCKTSKSALSQPRKARDDRELLARVGEFSSTFPWPAERSIAELAVEAESIRKVAAELQTSISRETKRTLYTESTNRKKRLERELADCARELIGWRRRNLLSNASKANIL